MTKKILCIVLSLLMSMSLCVFAAGNEENFVVVPISPDVQYGHNAYIDNLNGNNAGIIVTEDNEIPNSSASALPVSYDSRALGYVTPVKTQGLTGTCWAHAIVSTLETADIIDGAASVNSANYSEAHLSWFCLNPRDESGNSERARDGVNLGSAAFTEGGAWLNAVSALANLSGYNNESDYPFYPYNIDRMTCTETDRYVNTTGRMLDSITLFSGVDNIKRAVMEYGALYFAYYRDTSILKVFTQNGKEVKTTYCDTDKTITHASVIIGWDDNFSADNFVKKPKSNGAWLVKDSWGTSAKYDGCLWVSYEDASIEDVAGFKTAKNTVSNVYSYTSDMVRGVTYSGVAASNVYTPRATEKLTKISFQTYDENASYTVKIYTDLKRDTNPESGRLIASFNTGILGYGYYSFDVPGTPEVTSGKKFSVVVEYASDKDVKAFPVELANANNSYSEAGQSYLKVSGFWFDATRYNMGNFHIFAYTGSGHSPVSEPDTPGDTPEPVHTHTYQRQHVDATCVSEGYDRDVCSECGNIVIINILPKTDHVYGDEVQTGGNAFKRTCTKCGYTDTYSKNFNFFQLIWSYLKFWFKF